MDSIVHELESMFAKICSESYPLEWDENHLSFQLMKGMREMFSNRTIHFQKWSKIVDWKSFKNKGKQEQKYGDIALIVNVQFTSGETLKGVAVVEAKRSFDSDCEAGFSFNSLKPDQLDQIYSNAPYSHLLFYHHFRAQITLKFPNSSTWHSYMLISPINTAKQLLKQMRISDSSKLHRVSLPFTTFLTSRIFWGLDLDFREDVLSDIEMGLAKIISPSYLGVINVYYPEQRPVTIELANNWESI